MIGIRFLAACYGEDDPYGWGIWCDWPNEHPTKYDWAEDGLGMTEAESRAVAKRANAELGDGFDTETLRAWAREIRAAAEQGGATE